MGRSESHGGCDNCHSSFGRRPRCSLVFVFVMAFDSEAARLRDDHLSLHILPAPVSALPASPSRLPDRPHFPTRASTVGSTHDLSRHNLSPKQDLFPHAHSDDLNHFVSSRNDLISLPVSLPAPSPAFLVAGRPTTPSSPSLHSARTPTYDYLPDRTRRNSATSDASAHTNSSGSSSPNKGGPLTSTSSATSTNLSSSSVAYIVSSITSITHSILF